MMFKTAESKPITIYDIAKEAGVSPATVSRVMSNRAKVSSDKREKVLEVIEKYNFQPNMLAKGLANAGTRTIGIMAADVRNPFYAMLFVACEQAAKAMGYTVILCDSLDVKEQEIELLTKMKEQKVDAIIQMGGSTDDRTSDEEYAEAVNRYAADIPFVTTGKLDGTGCYMVRIDDRKCMELLMNHLLDLNHLRIALIGGEMDVFSTYDKYQRYKQILWENGLEFDGDLISENGGYDYKTGYEEMRKMLEKKAHPTAVICVNDMSAAGVVRCLQDHGIRIPEDISVVSYDNTPIAQLISPKLTTVDYDYETLGKSLVQTVVDLLEGNKPNRLRVIEPRLVIRESSGPAPEK